MDIFATNHSFEFGEAVYPNGGRFGPIHHKHLELFVVLEGEAVATVDGITETFKEGDTGFFYNEHSFEARYPRGRQTRIMFCGTGEVEFIIPTTLIPSIRDLPTKLPPSKLLIQLLKIGVDIGHSDNLNLQRKRNTLGETVFNEYFYLANLMEEEQPFPEPVLKAKRFMDEHFNSPCNLTTIAEQAALTPQHLTKLFKQCFDCTPTNYLWRLRSEKAIYLLRHSGLTIFEVASQCGFKDPYHFSRHIKKHYGAPPKEIRRNKWHPKPDLIVNN